MKRTLPIDQLCAGMRYRKIPNFRADFNSVVLPDPMSSTTERRTVK